MRCRKCGGKAVVNMRQHKLALCGEHFLDWLPEQIERTIRTYRMFTPQARILVAVSGGKDSLSLWDILVRLGYQADGLYIGLGIDEGIRYSAESRRLAEKFASEHNLRMHVVDIPTEKGDALERELKSFVDCVRTRGEPRVTGEQGSEALRLAADIRGIIETHPS